MAASDDPNATRSFFDIARAQGLLSADAVSVLTQETQIRGVPPSELVRQKGMMDDGQVDIVETLLRAGEVIPGYEILEVLGRGGMGVVYRARQRTLDRPVALKTILLSHAARPDVTARFEKEAMAVAALRHPNIVTAYDFGRVGQRLFFVMELLEGEDLETHIERRGRLDETTTWAIARQTIWGLAHAAERGLVHRDIKPGNLFLVTPLEGFALPAGVPMVKITDFGLVLLRNDPGAVRLTAADTYLGTPMYMAPEQIADRDVDSRADIYSLGATLFQMLSGKPPFAGAGVLHVLSQKTSGEQPSLAGLVSPKSAELVRDMMAVDPDKRIGNYRELLERVDQVTAVSSVSTGRAAGHGRFAVKGRRAWLVGAIAAGVALAVGVLWLGLHRNTASESEATAANALVPTGRESPLFEGTSLVGWQPLEGEWGPAHDSENGSVLSGQGIVRRSLPRLEHYRLSLSVDLHEAEAVELHFGILPAAAMHQPRYVLHYAGPGIYIARREDDRGNDKSLSAMFPVRRRSSDASPYRELRVERHETAWLAFFDGEPIGTVPLNPAETNEFRLIADGGRAFFESVEVVELSKKP